MRVFLFPLTSIIRNIFELARLQCSKSKNHFQAYKQIIYMLKLWDCPTHCKKKKCSIIEIMQQFRIVQLYSIVILFIFIHYFMLCFHHTPHKGRNITIFVFRDPLILIILKIHDLKAIIIFTLLSITWLELS